MRLPGMVISLAAAACASIGGCEGRQSALDPAGIQARRIYELAGPYFYLSATVYSLTMVLVIWAPLVRRRQTADVATLSPTSERRTTWIVGGAVGATVIALFALLWGDVATGISLRGEGSDAERTIRIVAHQWWWEVTYPDEPKSNTFTTANEIHLPIGRTVKLELASRDVIHSFWVPNLHGKRDVIPGQTTNLFVRADREGVFWGQCAEFCGLQHANMRIVVTAEPAAAFDAWCEAQRKPASEPESDAARHGRDVFLRSTCANCHTIQGTIGRGMVGPDLTHVGGRPLVGGMLANHRDHLARWIGDAQSVKPGIRMPSQTFRAEDLKDLAEYLSNLK